MPLNDPSLLTALKAQIQIGGTPQVNTFQATFHYQLAYRVQNHSLDIMVPGNDNSGDALFIDIDSNATPTCTYVPKKLSREELTKLLPDKWITNYEQIHQAPVQTTTTPDFIRHQDGQVEVRFAKQDRRDVFSTIHMIEPVPVARQEIHCICDPFCNCDACLDEAFRVEYDDDEPRRKKKGSQRALKKRYEAGDPNVGLLGEPSGKFDYYVLYGEPSKSETPNPKPARYKPPPTKPSDFFRITSSEPSECFVITPLTSTPEYNVEFPPLTTFENNQQKTKHSWKIYNPNVVGPNGIPSTITEAEETLNWQSENTVAQNNALKDLMSKQITITKTQEALLNKVHGIEGVIHEVKTHLKKIFIKNCFVLYKLALGFITRKVYLKKKQR